MVRVMIPQVEAAWIAGVSGFVGVLTGVGGTVIVAIRGFRSTSNATEAQIEAAAANVQAQIDADRAAQRRDRLAQAYTELGMYLSRHADWAASVRPYWGQIPTPDPLTPQDRWRVETAVTLYGSPEVGRLLAQWTDHARKIDMADDTIRRADKSASGDLDDEARKERIALPAYKAALAAADAAIRAQMNREIAT